MRTKERANERKVPKTCHIKLHILLHCLSNHHTTHTHIHQKKRCIRPFIEENAKKREARRQLKADLFQWTQTVRLGKCSETKPPKNHYRSMSLARKGAFVCLLSWIRLLFLYFFLFFRSFHILFGVRWNLLRVLMSFIIS